MALLSFFFALTFYIQQLVFVRNGLLYFSNNLFTVFQYPEYNGFCKEKKAVLYFDSAGKGGDDPVYFN